MQKIDYTKMGMNGQQVQSPEYFDNRWWLAKEDEMPQAIAGVVNRLNMGDSRRQTQYQISTRLYNNTNIMGISGFSYSRGSLNQSPSKDRITYNMVQSAIDTVVAKMSKNRPKPLFLTSGGDYKLQRKAKKLDKYVEGIFYENDAYHLGTRVFRDAAIFGDGIIHVFECYGRIKYERVIPSEMYVDPMEAFDGKPRQLHRAKNIDRLVLKDMFPGKKQLIENAQAARNDVTALNTYVADQLTVVESWHLPSGPDAKDGLHVLSLEEGVLHTEPWTKDYFPFAKMSWSEGQYGFWGQGAAEQLQSIQLEINKLLWVIQRSMHLQGSFKVLLENGSKIVKEHLNNDIGAIINYSGTPPSYVVPPMVAPEVYAHFMTLKNLGFEQVGVSQLSAGSLKPAGLNSGKALREYNDIESDRFNTIGKAYERLFVDLSKITVDMAKDLYERDGEYEVKVPNKTFLETIDWSQIDLDNSDFYLKIFPVSALPNDPAGRLQTVQEYVQAGFMSPRTARKLLDFPDVEQIEDLQNASEDYLHMILEKMIEDAYYTPPEPFDDLALAKELALEYYAQGKLNNLEEEKLDLLRQFIDQVALLVQRAMPPAPMPGAIPQANPQAMPSSDLIANVPGINPVAA